MKETYAYKVCHNILGDCVLTVKKPTKKQLISLAEYMGWTEDGHSWTSEVSIEKIYYFNF